MGFLYISFLAVVQGITEFLPVSSSGHLFLMSKIFNQPDQTLQVDVAVHFGTLVAITLFYKNDITSLLSGINKTISLNFYHRDARFLHLIILATLPVICVGFVLKITGLIYEIRSIKTIGWSMIIFGLILFLADKSGQKNRLKNSWSYRDALIMGTWQAIALIPGTSRSGTTISGAMFLGFSRESSVNLSLIMSVPTILASSLLLLIDLIRIDFDNADPTVLLCASTLSFLTAMTALFVFVRYVRVYSFTLFIIYRCLLGFLIL